MGKSPLNQYIYINVGSPKGFLSSGIHDQNLFPAFFFSRRNEGDEGGAGAVRGVLPVLRVDPGRQGAVHRRCHGQDRDLRGGLAEMLEANFGGIKHMCIYIYIKQMNK